LTDAIALGLLWYVVLLFSLTFHEAAHAWAALRGGDATAYHGGQVTLDPVPHMRREPFGMVVVPILLWVVSGGGWMFGWASTPYDPRWAYAHPRRAGWMSLAGPASNLVLVLLAALSIRAGLAAGVFALPDYATFAELVVAEGDVGGTAATLVSIAFTLNLVLLVFNLMPVPPLDGSGALGAFLPEDAARRVQEWMAQPGLALGGLLLAWWGFPYVFRPVHDFSLGVLYAGLLP